MNRRHVLGALALGMAGGAQAQASWQVVAVPFYTPADVLVGWYRWFAVPQARAAHEAALVLAQTLGATCRGELGMEQARGRWGEAVAAWERLSAVATGPVLWRRSLRQIDFAPTRPNLIERAVRAQPRGAEALERIGTPAKGWPALEWLLWRQPMAAASPACAYAQELGQDLARHMQALRDDFERLAQRTPQDWSEAEVAAGMDELVNQWVGAVERLRWAAMEKPLRSGALQTLPRQTSGRTVQSWRHHWEAIAALARAGAQVPTPGEGLVSFESYLRGRGWNELADRWRAAVEGAERGVLAATPQQPETVTGAAQALAALKRLAESELAPAFDVRMGFSDADGD
ncbi:MAG: imelysin family protein [Caldimonas manganoxidans]|nr:imelysin family protein [Caldimonas manganoxidans]